MAKKYLDKNVYDAAKERIKWCIENFDDFYVSFSGGKDSGALLELVIEVAREMNRLPVKAVFSDLEVIFQETVNYVLRTFDRPEVQGYWLCLEELDENASSIYERYFKIWDKNKKDQWIHQPPNRPYVITDDNCPENLKKYLQPNRVDFWSIELFGEFLCDEYNLKSICNFIGMRSEESWGRHMLVKVQKHRTKLNQFTYKTKSSGDRTWISLPMYDWEYSDVWKYIGSNEFDYNKIYDKMLKLGLSFPSMRTCSAFGEEQKKSLYYWQIFEPETFEKMLKRVEGVNFGARYNHTNINRGKIRKPKNISWKEYLDILMAELPEDVRKNFQEKFDITFRYHKVMYEDKLGLSPEFYILDSRAEEKEMINKGYPTKWFITYEDLCNAIIKRDFVFKKYGFGYSNKMQERIERMYEKWEEL